jgi:hypothetical protein
MTLIGKKIAMICASGLGDSVMMTILATNGSKHAAITLFHPHPVPLIDLFPNIRIEHFDAYHPRDFDLSLVQNDHSARAYQLDSYRQEGYPVIFICPKPSQLASQADFIFDQQQTFVDNILAISKKLFDSDSRNNSLERFHTLSRRNPKEVFIHYSNAKKSKLWPMKKMEALYLWLKKTGFQPIFVMTEQEKQVFPWPQYPHLSGLTLPELAHRMSLGSYFIGCDSGLGHFASCLKLPTLTIAYDPYLMRVWRPGFHVNKLVAAPFKLPRLPFLGTLLRERCWHYFISVDRVKQAFMQLIR